MLLVSRQGKVRLAKWFTTMSTKAKSKFTNYAPPNHSLSPARAVVNTLTRPDTLPCRLTGKIVKDVTQLVLARRTRMCNFLEYKGRHHPKEKGSVVTCWVLMSWASQTRN